MTDTSQTGQAHKALDFDSDRGASRSTWIAAAILIAIVAWMGSGFVLPSEEEAAPVALSEPAPVAVSVRSSTAKPVTLFFQAEGQAQPDRDTAIRAEASGDVAELLVSKGEDVAQGQVIARLSTKEAEASLRRAQEEFGNAQRELSNAETLLQRGIATEDRVTEARADLAAAQAQVTSAEEALHRTKITAPFDGRIETLSLDEGEFIAAGSDVGRIVDNQPLTVELQVPQQSLGQIRNGLPAQVAFITGEQRAGTVTFVGTSASAETRTFLAEVEVQNADGAIPAGISAEINMPTGEVSAHFVSPSVISLNPTGEIGIKTVEDGHIVFREVDVVRPEVDGVWVTGLPDEVQLVTIGQGYVRDGEKVDARPEEAAQ